MGEVNEVVIVGAGLAGHSAATTLRERGFDGSVVLLGAEDVPPYDRPALSKEVLAGKWDASRIVMKPAEWFHENGIELRLGTRVVDVRDRVVVTSTGEEIGFDALVLATGGAPRVPDVPGVDLDGIHYVRDIADISRIRARLDQVEAAVVVGAGFIGSEAAASLRASGLEVTMVEMAEQPLARVLGAEVGALIADVHRAEGVDVVCGEAVTAFDGDTDVRAVVGASGERYEGDLAIVGLGIVPEVELAVRAGCVLDERVGGVAVDAEGRTSVPSIWAVGDLAAFPSRFGSVDHSVEAPLRVEHYAHAVAHGANAALSILGVGAPYREIPWFWSDQYDVSFKYIGHAVDWDMIEISGDPGDRRFAARYMKDGRLLAAFCANSNRDFKAAKKELAAAVTIA